MAIQFEVYDWDGGARAAVRSLDAEPDNGIGLAVIGRTAESLCLVYDTGGTVYRRISGNECRTWSEAVSIASGTKPAIGYSREDDVEMIAYIDTSNHIRVRRRLGATNTLESAVAVDDNITVTSVAIQRLTGTRSGRWVIVASDSGGTVRRYYSDDNGRTWVEYD